MPTRRAAALLALLAAGLVLPFAGKPVHVDDANFLALARGARLSPWAPHDVLINWQGHTERAFDVLSNPPGVAWWLAPVAHGPAALQHLAIWLWLPLVLWGAWRLGRRFAGDGLITALLVLTSPIVLLAAHGLTPDLPLLALTLAGVAGFVEATDADHPLAALGWAVVAGGAFLFRYSGICLLPLLLLYPLLRRKAPWAALGAALPPLLLLGHDLHAYGAFHFLSMGGFQAVALEPRDIFRKGAAAVAMLGGAGLVPLLALQRPRVALTGGLVGLGLGWAAASASQQPLVAGALTCAFCAGGGVLLAGLVPPRLSPRRDALFLATWAAGGFVFLLLLRFMAARYWLPFMLPVLLVWLRHHPPRRLLAAAVLLQTTLALALASAAIALAYAYNAFGKGLGLLGNMMVSCCVAIPFVYGSLLAGGPPSETILAFAAMAFRVATIRVSAATSFSWRRSLCPGFAASTSASCSKNCPSCGAETTEARQRGSFSHLRALAFALALFPEARFPGFAHGEDHAKPKLAVHDDSVLA